MCVCLQRWEEYNRELHRAGRQTGDAGGAGQETAGPSTATRLSGAAEALQRWNRVSRKARQALRKANIHSVLALESQVCIEAIICTNIKPRAASPTALSVASYLHPHKAMSSVSHS